jgi:hypothetical protein
MPKKEGYSKQMERKLAEWMARFDNERAAAVDAGNLVTANVREKLEAWKVAGDAAMAKLAELRAAAARWGQLRDELDAIWLSIERTGGGAPAAEPERPTPKRRASGAS